MATCPIKEFFDIPELAEQVVQYLTRHEVLQCMKTCKALYNLKQYFFHHVELKERHPAPDDLARYRYHIRILNVPCDEPVNLKAIAKDLPRRTLSKAAASGIKDLGRASSRLSSLDRHVFHHLRSISLLCNSRLVAEILTRIDMVHGADILSGTKVTSLAQLDSFFHLKATTTSFLRILYYSPYVHSLTLPAEILNLRDPSLVEQFLDTMANRTPSLIQLCLSGGSVTPKLTFRLLEICFKHPRLRLLHCDFELMDNDCSMYPHAGDRVNKKAIIDPSFDAFLKSLDETRQSRSEPGAEPWATRLEGFRPPVIDRGYPEAFLISLFRSHIPRLKSFHIPRTSSTLRVQEIQEAVAQGCKELEYIMCGEMADDRTDELTVKAILQGCTVQNGCLGLKHFIGLDIYDRNLVQGRREILQTLISNHSETLQRIEFEGTGLVESSDLRDMFSSCKNLKKFTMYARPSGRGSITFGDVISKEWVCRDIEMLRIVLNRHIPLGPGENEFEDSDGDSDQDTDNDASCEEDEQSQNEDEDEETFWNEEDAYADDEYRYSEDEYFYLKHIKGFWARPRPQESKVRRRTAQQVYGQIGRMNKLRELSLGWDDNLYVASWSKAFKFDLTLKYGWLSELAGLKELRHFEMSANFWSHIDQAEVEFMHAHWPNLEKISFAVRDLERETKKEHWVWLKGKRPNLELGRLRSWSTWG
ncbi:MAG: hypothetical protein J3Q66DRAFT_397462 [Benniella sp.]|nr:MAG: hypothetical protein J3Q66DRAFT_397462 [Benniella sp.]